MPAWNEARRLGRQARAIAQGKRAAPAATLDALPMAKERFERQVCVYCGSNRRLRTGYLVISGPVFYCKDHAEYYQGDKPWEERHKRSI
jgi:hypothetical protein